MEERGGDQLVRGSVRLREGGALERMVELGDVVVVVDTTAALVQRQDVVDRRHGLHAIGGRRGGVGGQPGTDVGGEGTGGSPTATSAGA